jgi:putative inorganic carbon (HCO3(-)) transporter
MSVRLFAPALRPLTFVLGYGSAATWALLCALFTNFLGVSGHDLQRCVELAALSVVGLVFIVRAGRGQRLDVRPATYALLLGFFALGLVSASSAHSLHHAIYEWSIFLLLLALVFSIAAELGVDYHRLTGTIHWVGIVCGLYSLRLLLMYLVALTSGYQMNIHALAIGFGSARVLNHAQTPLLPLIVLLCLRAPLGDRWHRMWFVLAAFWWALLFVLEARATVLALCIGCTVACVLRRGHARQYMIIMARTAIAGVVIYMLVFLLLPVLAGLHPAGTPVTVIERTVANPSSSRNLLWTRALQLIVAHPWFGIGPLHFAHVGSDLNTGAHPHNWLLQIGVEWGIPALLCALCIVFLGARALVRTGARISPGDTANHQILVTLLVACTAIFIDGLFSGVLVMPQSQLAIALVLGVACAWVRLQHGANEPEPALASIPRRGVAISLIAAALSALIWSVAPDLVHHANGEALTPAELAHNPDIQWARMWQAGFF